MIGWLKITETSAVAEARRRARCTANAVGLNSLKVEHAAIVATEIAQNVLRHGGGGRMLIEVFGAPSLERLHIVGHDEGPGIGRVDRMMRDGETTKGSPGTGLGAIKRLSDRIDIFSEAGRTVVAAEFRRAEGPPRRSCRPCGVQARLSGRAPMRRYRCGSLRP